jgi:hypothetical protein
MAFQSSNPLAYLLFNDTWTMQNLKHSKLFWLWNVVSVWRMASTSVHRIIGGDQTHEHGVKVLHRVWCALKSLESSVGIVTRLQAGRPRYHLVASGCKISTRVSIPAIEPTLPPTYCVQSPLSLEVKQMGHECDYLHPPLNLRLNGAMLPPTLMPGWHVHG